MLKGFVSGEEKDIKRIPMEGKNVMPAGEQKTVSNRGITFESDGKGRYHVYGTATGEASAKFNLARGFITPISVSNNGQGTLSFFNNQRLSDVTVVFYNGASQVDDWVMSPLQRTSTAYNAIGNKYVDNIGLRVRSGTQVDVLISPEFTNDGVLPTEFTPHYQEGWEVRDNQDRLIWGRELVHYGFKIDKSNGDSEDAVIYTHDAVTMIPAHMDFTNDRFDYGSWENAFFVRDCYPVALNLDGTIAYRLDPDDYTKKMDGTPSDIFYELLSTAPSDWSTQWKQYYTKSGDEYVLNNQASAPTFAQDTYYKLTYSSSFTGNFMMAFPKVWFYRHEDSQYNYIEISNHRLSDDWKCYAHINASGQEVDFIYLPLFKGIIKDSKLRSLPGQIPHGGTAATTEVNAATALGSRWQIWDHSSVECINDLLTLMSKSIDSQGRFGQGRSTGYDSTDTVTYGKLQSGTLIKKGKFHGYSATTKEVKVFGIEGFWANRFDRLQGMLLVDNVWKIKMTPPYNFTGTDFVTLSNAEVPSGNGYLSKVQASEYGSIPASIVNGSSTRYFKDYLYKTETGTRVALRGGYCGSGGYAGFRFVSVNYAASNSYRGIGASPVYK